MLFIRTDRPTRASRLLSKCGWIDGITLDQCRGYGEMITYDDEFIAGVRPRPASMTVGDWVTPLNGALVLMDGYLTRIDDGIAQFHFHLRSRHDDIAIETQNLRVLKDPEQIQSGLTYAMVKSGRCTCHPLPLI